MAKTNLDRRTFHRVSALAGGGFMLGLYSKAAPALLAQGGGPAPAALLPADFVRIASNGIVSITSRNPETGQHSLSPRSATLFSRLQVNAFGCCRLRSKALVLRKGICSSLEASDHESLHRKDGMKLLAATVGHRLFRFASHQPRG
jgi:hypothetical protein